LAFREHRVAQCRNLAKKVLAKSPTLLGLGTFWSGTLNVWSITFCAESYEDFSCLTVMFVTCEVTLGTGPYFFVFAGVNNER
jgi:hypothetical protein